MGEDVVGEDVVGVAAGDDVAGEVGGGVEVVVEVELQAEISNRTLANPSARHMTTSLFIIVLLPLLRA